MKKKRKIPALVAWSRRPAENTAKAITGWSCADLADLVHRGDAHNRMLLTFLCSGERRRKCEGRGICLEYAPTYCGEQGPLVRALKGTRTWDPKDARLDLKNPLLDRFLKRCLKRCRVVVLTARGNPPAERGKA